MKNLYLLIFIVLFGSNRVFNEADLSYSPFSNSVIEIHNLRTNSDTIHVEASANTNVPRGRSDSNILTIIGIGRYYLNIEIDRPVSSQVNIKDEIFNVLIEPNDTVKLTIKNKENLEIDFEDKYAEINTYYLNKKEKLGYYDIRNPLNKKLTPKSNYNSLKQSVDSITNIELAFLENYKSNLPDWFMEFEFLEITYSGASFKTMLPNYNKIFKVFSDVLPDNYFNYLEDIPINNPQAILSSKYLWFLDDYFIREIPEKFNNLSGFERSSKIRSYILTKSKVELSGKVKDIYHKYNFSSMIRFYKDSVEIDSLAKEFELEDYKSLIQISGTKSQNGRIMLDLNPGDTIPDFYVTNDLDSLVSIRNYTGKILYINFWATWCGPCIQNMPALNEMIEEFKDDENIAFLNICLDSEKEKWPITISKHNIQGINLIAEGNWNSRIKSYFNINGIPHYTILNENNILLENFANKAPAVKEKIIEVLSASNDKSENDN